jgi:hypothetical protein
MNGQCLTLTVVARTTLAPPRKSGRFSDDQIFKAERWYMIVLKLGFKNLIDESVSDRIKWLQIESPTNQPQFAQANSAHFAHGLPKVEPLP